jgi:hypothetical protein
VRVRVRVREGVWVQQDPPESLRQKESVPATAPRPATARYSPRIRNSEKNAKP